METTIGQGFDYESGRSVNSVESGLFTLEELTKRLRPYLKGIIKSDITSFIHPSEKHHVMINGSIKMVGHYDLLDVNCDVRNEIRNQISIRKEQNQKGGKELYEQMKKRSDITDEIDGEIYFKDGTFCRLNGNIFQHINKDGQLI